MADDYHLERFPPICPRPETSKMATNSSVSSVPAITSLSNALPVSGNSSAVSSVVTVTRGASAVPLSMVCSQVPVMVVNPMQHKKPSVPPVTLTTQSIQTGISSHTTSTSSTSVNFAHLGNNQMQMSSQNTGFVIGNPFNPFPGNSIGNPFPGNSIGNPFPGNAFSSNVLTGNVFPTAFVQRNPVQGNLIISPLIQGNMIQGNVYQGNFSQNLSVPSGMVQINPQQFFFQNTPQVTVGVKPNAQPSNVQPSASTDKVSSKSVRKKTPTARKTIRKESSSLPSFRLEPDPEFNEKLKNMKVENIDVVANEDSVNSFKLSTQSANSQSEQLGLGDSNSISVENEEEFTPKIEYCYSMKTLSLIQMMELLDKGQNVMKFVKPGTKDFSRALVLCEAIVKHHVTGINKQIKEDFYTSLLSPDIRVSEVFRLKKEIKNALNLGNKECTDLDERTVRKRCNKNDRGDKTKVGTTDAKGSHEAAQSSSKWQTEKMEIIDPELYRKYSGKAKVPLGMMENQEKGKDSEPAKDTVTEEETFAVVGQSNDSFMKETFENRNSIIETRNKGIETERDNIEAKLTESETKLVKKEYSEEVMKQKEIESERESVRKMNILKNNNYVETELDFPFKDALQKEADAIETETEAELIRKAFTLSKFKGTENKSATLETEAGSTSNLSEASSYDAYKNMVECIDDMAEIDEQSLEICLPNTFYLSKWSRTTLAGTGIFPSVSDLILKYCYLCGLQCSDASSTWQHILNEHSKCMGDSSFLASYYFCSHCYKIDKSMKAIRQHELDVHLCEFPCYFCGVSLDNQWEMSYHIVDEHSPMYTCSTCKGEFRGSSGYNNHLAIWKDCQKNSYRDRKVSLFICLFCNVKYNSKANLRRHQESAHIDTPTPNKNEEVCSSCRHSFLDTEALLHHRNPDARKPNRTLSIKHLNSLAEQSTIDKQKVEAIREIRKEAIKRLKKNCKVQNVKIREWFLFNLDLEKSNNREIVLFGIKLYYPLQKLLAYCEFGKDFPASEAADVMDKLLKLLLLDFSYLQVDNATKDLQDLLVSVSRSQKFSEILKILHLNPFPWNERIESCVNRFISKVKAGCYRNATVAMMKPLLHSLQRSINFIEKKRFLVVQQQRGAKSPEWEIQYTQDAQCSDLIKDLLQARIKSNSDVQQETNPSNTQNEHHKPMTLTDMKQMQILGNYRPVLPKEKAVYAVREKLIKKVGTSKSKEKHESVCSKILRNRESSVKYTFDDNLDESDKETSHFSNDLAETESDDEWKPPNAESESEVESEVESSEDESESVDEDRPEEENQSDESTNDLMIISDTEIETETEISNPKDAYERFNFHHTSNGKDTLGKNKAETIITAGKADYSDETVVTQTLQEQSEPSENDLSAKEIFPPVRTFNTLPYIQKRHSSEVMEKIVPTKISNIAESANCLRWCTRRMPSLNKLVKCSYIKIDRSSKADDLVPGLVASSEDYTDRKFTRTFVKQICEKLADVTESVDDADLSLRNLTSENLEHPQKRGQGRPNKVSHEDQMEIRENDNDTILRKRGRPKNKRETKTIELLETPSLLKDIGISEEILPRKRGRFIRETDQSKTQLSNDTSFLKDSSVKDSTTTQIDYSVSKTQIKRKRGRPRKLASESECKEHSSYNDKDDQIQIRDMPQSKIKSLEVIETVTSKTTDENNKGEDDPIYSPRRMLRPRKPFNYTEQNITDDSNSKDEDTANEEKKKISADYQEKEMAKKGCVNTETIGMFSNINLTPSSQVKVEAFEDCSQSQKKSTKETDKGKLTTETPDKDNRSSGMLTIKQEKEDPEYSYASSSCNNQLTFTSSPPSFASAALTSVTSTSASTAGQPMNSNLVKQNLVQEAQNMDLAMKGPEKVVQPPFSKIDTNQQVIRHPVYFYPQGNISTQATSIAQQMAQSQQGVSATSLALVQVSGSNQMVLMNILKQPENETTSKSGKQQKPDAKKTTQVSKVHAVSKTKNLQQPPQVVLQTPQQVKQGHSVHQQQQPQILQQSHMIQQQPQIVQKLHQTGPQLGQWQINTAEHSYKEKTAVQKSVPFKTLVDSVVKHEYPIVKQEVHTDEENSSDAKNTNLNNVKISDIQASFSFQQNSREISTVQQAPMFVGQSMVQMPGMMSNQFQIVQPGQVQIPGVQTVSTLIPNQIQQNLNQSGQVNQSLQFCQTGIQQLGQLHLGNVANCQTHKIQQTNSVIGSQGSAQPLMMNQQTLGQFLFIQTGPETGQLVPIVNSDQTGNTLTQTGPQSIKLDQTKSAQTGKTSIQSGPIPAVEQANIVLPTGQVYSATGNSSVQTGQVLNPSQVGSNIIQGLQLVNAAQVGSAAVQKVQGPVGLGPVAQGPVVQGPVGQGPVVQGPVVQGPGVVPTKQAVRGKAKKQELTVRGMLQLKGSEMPVVPGGSNDVAEQPDQLPFKCEECDSYHKSQADLDRHQLAKLHFKFDEFQGKRIGHRNSWKCRRCFRMFRNHKQFLIHFKMHLEGKFVCSTCFTQFDDKLTLYEHDASEHSKLFWCKMCKRKFSSKDSCMNHVLRFHDSEEEDIKNYLEEFFICKSCHIQFSDEATLRKHLLQHFGGFTCKMCDLDCRNAIELEMHHMSKHGKKWECNLCGEVKSCQASMTSHIRSVHPFAGQHENQFSAFYDCKLCDKRFKDGEENAAVFHLKYEHTFEIDVD